MRVKKIRGHKRIWKEIETWKNANLQLDIESLKIRQRDYTKIYVHPYSSISIINSAFPQPKGETRKRILNALFEIYEQWEQQLKTLKEPYYLKIWFYEPRFSSSQVVCAIGKCLHFYDSTFHRPEISKNLNTNNLGSLKHNISNYNWEYRLDEYFLNNNDLGSPEDYETEKDYFNYRRWLKRKLKNPHRTIHFEESIGKKTESYAFKQGVVWLGSK